MIHQTLRLDNLSCGAYEPCIFSAIAFTFSDEVPIPVLGVEMTDYLMSKSFVPFKTHS